MADVAQFIVLAATICVAAYALYLAVMWAIASAAARKKWRR
jgi:hypothetical protein